MKTILMISILANFLVAFFYCELNRKYKTLTQHISTDLIRSATIALYIKRGSHDLASNENLESVKHKLLLMRDLHLKDGCVVDDLSRISRDNLIDEISLLDDQKKAISEYFLKIGVHKPNPTIASPSNGVPN